MFYLKLTHYSNSNSLSSFYIKNKDTGVGNMLFQIASGIVYCTKFNSELYIIGLNTFFRLEELKKEDTIFRNIKNRENVVINQSLNIDWCVNGRRLIYEIPYIDNMMVCSYFENYNNFHSNRDLIVNLFSPNEKDRSYLHNKYPMLYNKNVASIQIRCGPIYRRNYKITNENIIENELTQLYYKSLDKMLEIKSIQHIIICSDDIDYSQKIMNIEKYKQINFVYSNERDYMDIWLMSLIKNNIISFSTLSWWGAYLNTNVDKCIVCCKEFREDLHMPGWIII